MFVVYGGFVCIILIRIYGEVKSNCVISIKKDIVDE